MLRGRKLLLADDSVAIQKVIELTFEDEGMQVLSVGDGRQAVERIKEVRPDIVLADVFMPEPNGYQVCEWIKRDERFRHIPVVLLVGSFEPFNEAEARRVGADDYLTKPFQSIRQMVSKVGALLSGNKNAEANTQELPARNEQSQSESQARMSDLELTTADTAPLPQHMRREIQENSDAQSKGPFADLQLDDEMIEETPASEFGPAGQGRADSQQRSTEPFSTRDLAEVGVTSAGTGSGQQLASGGANVLTDEEHERDGVFELSSTPARRMDRAATGDDALLDLDDVEMPRSAAMAEADDFILDLQDEAQASATAPPPAEAVSPSYESAEAHVGEDETAIEAKLTEEMTESAPQAAEFTEAQVVGEEQRAEFAPIEEQQPSTREFNFYQQGAAESSQEQTPESFPTTAQLAPTEKLPGAFRSEETPAQVETESAPEAASASGMPPSEQGQIGLAQLSPEAIDAIARRVVEQLSTKVVEQIAWEVVPPLAELLIKRRLEEEGKQ